MEIGVANQPAGIETLIEVISIALPEAGGQPSTVPCLKFRLELM